MASRPSIPEYDTLISDARKLLPEDEYDIEAGGPEEPEYDVNAGGPEEEARLAGHLTGGQKGDVISVDRKLYRPQREGIPDVAASTEGLTPKQRAAVERGLVPFDPSRGDTMGGISLEEQQREDMGPVSRPGFAGAMKDVASGLAGGTLMTAPQQVMGMVGTVGDLAKRAGLPNVGQGLTDFADEQIEMNKAAFGGIKAIAPSEEETDGSFVRKALGAAARNLPASLAIAGPASFGGAALARALGGGAKAVQWAGRIGGASGGLGFGLAEYYGALQEGLDAGLDIKESRSLAQKSGAIEALGEMVFGAILGNAAGKALAPWRKAATEAVKSGDTTLRRFLTPTLKQNLLTAAEVQFAESATEFGQEYGEAYVRQEAGVPTENPLYAGALGATSAVFMGGLFGLGTIQAQAQERRRLLADLNNTADKDAQLDAAARISAGLKKHDERMSDLWGAAAITNIARGEPIPVDSRMIDLPESELRRITKDAITPGEDEIPALKEQAQARLDQLEAAVHVMRGQNLRVPPEVEAERLWMRSAVADDAVLLKMASRAAPKPGAPVDLATGESVPNPTAAPSTRIPAEPTDMLIPKGPPPLPPLPARRGIDAPPPTAPSREAIPQGPPALPGRQAAPGAAPAGPSGPAPYNPDLTPIAPALPGRGISALPSTSPLAAAVPVVPPAGRRQIIPGGPPALPGPGQNIATRAPAVSVAGQQRPTSPGGGTPRVFRTPRGLTGVPRGVRGERPTIASVVDRAAHEAATSPLNDLQQPTEAQREAGNYAKGHVNVQGLDISIENPEGSQRTGTRPDGSQWSTTMQDHYGYIKGTVGKDGDHVDVFVGKNHESDNVFVVNQNSPKTGAFDEHKVMLGYGSEAEARVAYLANYEQGWQGLGSIVPMSMDQFKEWKDSGEQNQPAKSPAAERTAVPAPKEVRKARGITNTGGADVRRGIPEGRKPQTPVRRPGIKELINEEEASPQEEPKAPPAPVAEAGPAPGTPGADADAGQNAPDVLTGGKSRVEQDLDAMSLEDLDALVDSGGKETPKTGTIGGQREKGQRPIGPKKEANGLTNLLGKAAKEVGSGAEEALRGLWELAGRPGGGTATSGGVAGLDRESYDKAKPHFQKAWEHWKTAGKTLQEFVKFILENIPGVKLQLKGYLHELKTGEDPVMAEEKALPVVDEEPAVEEPSVEPVTAEVPAEEEPQDETIGTGDEFIVENVGGAENTGGGGKRTRTKKGEASAPETATNTFTDKGEVWDPYKRALDKAAADATETSIKKVIAKAARSKVFAFTPQEGATPGVARYAASIRDEIYTFQEYYVRKIMQRGFESKIIGRVKQWSETSQRDAEMESLKTEAAKYMAFAAEIAKALKAKNVAEARANIRALLWKEDSHKDLGQIWKAAADSANQTEFMKSNVERFDSTLSYVYRTIQSANFEANENDTIIGIRQFNRTFRKDITRVGLEDYRKGKNIESTDAFDAPFEFKGVAFGNWVDQKERQRVANGAFDALHDLAMVMGTDTRKIPFTSRMQIQFGNIGTLNSRAAALYVPTADAINLSKTSGDGALAHEWGHALDKHIKSEGRSLAGSAPGVSVHEARQDLYKRLSYKLDFEAGEAFVKGLFGQMEYYRRYMRQGSETALETIKRVASQGYEAAVKVDSQFQKNAESAPNSQYYSKNEELWARAFEAWVYDQLKEKGGENSYLVDEFSSDGFLSPENGYKATIYPAGEERKQFNEYFTAFTKALQFNEDGTIGIDPAYEMIQAKDLAQIIEQREALLARIEELYNEQFPAKQSADGLYWYAYEEMKRAKTMQPDGYFAYDDSYSSGADGLGAVGYPATLSLDQMLDFQLAAIEHEANDKTVYLKEGEHAEESVEGPRGVALEDDEASDVENTGGERVPGERPGERGEPGEEGLSDTFEAGDQGGSGAGDRSGEVGVSPEREGEGDVEPRSDAVPAASNYQILDVADLSRTRTITERFADNVAAIRTLKQVEAEGRLPTLEEKDILALYSGWGGLGEALNKYGSYTWDSKRKIVGGVTTEEERQGLLESSDVAYFTPADVYAAAYKALEHMGFEGGKVLGPALGVGREFGTLPAHLRGAQTTLMAAEPEPFSYRISKLLYGQANIQNTTFEKAHLPLNYFDLGISNVPFRAVAPADKKYNKENFQLHDYFFRKQLALLRPGGMIAFLTSTGTMDKEASLFRDTLAREGGEFIAAFRLPAIHNQANALADLIFIRKTVAGSAIESPAWQKTKEFQPAGQSVSAKVNEYFVDYPERVLGAASVRTNRWGDLAMHVEQRQGESPADLIEAAIPSLPKDIMKQSKVEEEIKAEDLLPAPGDIRNHTYFVKDGAVFFNQDGVSVAQEGVAKAKNIPIIKGLVGIKEQVWKLFRAESAGATNEEVEAERKTLNDLYDSFVKDHPKSIDSHLDLIADDEEMPLLAALETIDEDTEVVSKADVFSKRTLPKYEIPTHADNVDDALSFSLSYQGKVDLGYIQRLTGMSPETIVEQLAGRVFDDPASGMTTADDYLSGNVREKLREAQVDQKYQRNVDALLAVQPAEISTSDIYMPIGAPIIPSRAIAEFMNEHLELENHRIKAVVDHSEKLNVWTIKFVGTGGYSWKATSDTEVKRRIKFMMDRPGYQKHGVKHKDGHAVQLMKWMLNNIPIVIKTSVPDGNGGSKLAVDDKLTTLANDRAVALQEAWERWWKSSAFAKKMSTRYNETNNTEVLFRPDGSHLTLPGKSAHIKLDKHQLNAIWRYIVKGNTYLAHEVGTGKTYEMAAIAMESRRLKLKRKPVLLADGPAKIRQLEREFLKLYPLAKLLVVDIKKDPIEKQKQLARIRTGDYDSVIMTKESFGRVSLSPEREAIFLQRQVDEMMQYESTLGKDDAKYASEIAKQIASLKAKVEKLLEKKTGGDLNMIYFDDLGIDLILADEAHAFKNVPFITRLTRRDSKIRGINPAPSGRATDFYSKAQFMNEVYPRGMVMASGTPLTNSIAELFNISRLLQPQELERRGIEHFDAWISMFGQIKAAPEFAPDSSGYRMVQKIVKFRNLPELKKMVRSVIDIVTAEQAGVKRPKIRGGAAENVIIEQNKDVAGYQQVILKRALAYQGDPAHAEWGGTRDNMLRIVADGKKAAIDMRLIDFSYKEQVASKVHEAAKRIMEEYNLTSTDQGVQLVFADLGVPGWGEKKERKLSSDDLNAMEPEARLAYEQDQFSVSTSGWNLYEGLRDKLVEMGIPKEEIEFIQSAPGKGKAYDAWIKKTFQAVRDGKIRVFFGSSKTLGTGVNVQDNITAIHHMDILWNLSDLVQRNGRGWRRGNKLADKFGGIALHNYIVKKTSDGFVWDKVFTKGKIIDSIMSDNMSLREVDDVSDDTQTAMEAAAEASGDVTYLELSKVEDELRKLTYRESEFQEDRRRAESDMQKLPGRIQAAQKSVERLKEDLSLLEPVDAVVFDGDPQVYVLEKHGKLIAAKLEGIWKSKETQGQLDVSVSTMHHIATLGKATEKEEPAAEIVLDAEGKPVKTEKPKKTYDFADVPVRVYMRKFTVGLQGLRAGVVLGLSGKLSANMEKPFTEGVRSGSMAKVQVFKKGKLGFEEAKAGKMGTISETMKVKGEITEVTVTADDKKEDSNPITGNLSRTVTLSKTALKEKSEFYEKEASALAKSEAELQAVLDRSFPETEKILDLRERKARLEQLQREMAAQGRAGQGRGHDNVISVDEDTGSTPSFASPASSSRQVIYKPGSDSRELHDLKTELISDPRFKADPELQARIQAIQEVQAPNDEDSFLSEQIRKIMGPEAKVVFVDSAGMFREVHHEVIGVGDVVYVDIRAPQILSSLVAHGLWHADKSRYKAILIAVLKQTVDPKKFQAMAREFRKVPHYAKMTDEQLYEEFGARFLEGQVAQEGFWKDLAKRSRVVYLRMAKWIIDTLNKFGIHINGKPPVFGEYFSSQEKMAAAVRATQDYFLGKLGDLQQGQGVAGGARFNISVWHGGRGGIAGKKEFDLKHAHSGAGGLSHGWGAYFTTMKDLAARYAEMFKGSLYGATIKAEERDMIDWTKTVGQQTRAIKEKIDSAFYDTGFSLSDEHSDMPIPKFFDKLSDDAMDGSLNSDQIEEEKVLEGYVAPEDRTPENEDDFYEVEWGRGVRRTLFASGIPGIKDDSDERLDPGKGHFIVWDNSLIEMDTKDGQPLFSAAIPSDNPFASIASRLFTPGESNNPLADAAENPYLPAGVTEAATPEAAVAAIRKDPTWGKMFLRVPDKDLKSWVRVVALPWWIAKKDIQGRKVMNVQILRDEKRNEMTATMLRSTAGAHLSEEAVDELQPFISKNASPADVVAFARNEKTALHKFFKWGGTQETNLKLARAWLRVGQVHEFMALDFKEAEHLGKVISESDSYVERDDDGNITRIGRLFSEDDLKKKGYNKKQIVAYYAWKKAMDAAWETKFTFARASIFWPHQGKSWMVWGERKVGPPALRALPISDLEKVADGAMKLEQAIENMRQIAEASGGFSIKTATKEFNRALKSVNKPFSKMKEFREKWGKTVRFYMPRMRDQGPIVVRAIAPGKESFYNRYTPLPGTSISREAKVDYDRLIKEYGPAVYDDGKVLISGVETYNSPVMPEDIYGDVSSAALEKFVGRAIGRLQTEGEITDEEAQALTEGLFQEMAHDLNARGFGQRALQRSKGEATKGYKEKNYQEIFRDYMSGMAGFLSKRQAAMEFHQALAAMRPARDEAGKPAGPQRWKAFDYWRKYAEDMLRNTDRGDEISAKVRSLAFLYFLSGNLKSAAVNLTQSFVSTIPVGSSITKGATGKVYKAMRDVSFNRLSPNEVKAMREAHDRGATTAQFIEDVMDRANQGRGGAWKKMSAALSYPFSKAEEFNRKVAFLFAYRVFSVEKGVAHGQAIHDGQGFVNDTQYMFGKANLPEWARSGTGPGKVARTAYTFRSYTHNYISAMANYMTADPAGGRDSREIQVLARSLAMLALLGGAGAGLPFIDDLLDYLERVMGIQWRSKMRQFIARHFGTIAERFWVAGLPALFGFDISGSLKIGLPGTNVEETVYGVYGGMIDKGSKAMQMAKSGQYVRAAETMAPSFIANSLRATREVSRGMTTPTGKIKFDENGRPMKLGAGEAAGRALGFRPVRDTIASQTNREYQNLTNHFKDQRQNLENAYRSARPDERGPILRDIQAYNRSVLKYRGVVPKIDPSILRRMIHQKPGRGFMNYQRRVAAGGM